MPFLYGLLSFLLTKIDASHDLISEKNLNNDLENSNSPEEWFRITYENYLSAQETLDLHTQHIETTICSMVAFGTTGLFPWHLHASAFSSLS